MRTNSDKNRRFNLNSKSKVALIVIETPTNFALINTNE